MTKRKRETTIAAPADLSERSKELWGKVAGKRARSPGRLEMLHQALLALERAEEAAVILKKEGMTFRTERTGAIHLHPAAKIEWENRVLFTRIWDGTLNLSWGEEDQR